VRGLLLLVTAGALGLACAGDSDGGRAGDAGSGGDGLILTDVAPDAERLVVAPTAVTFNDVPVGQTDVQSVVLTNASTAELLVSEVAVVDSVSVVRFTTSFVRSMAESWGWVDTDGDGQGFEVRDQPASVAPGATFEVDLQFRPNGGQLDCPDRAPAPCGFLTLTGQTETVSVPLYVPR
jgi:hypothetical protein